ncbi:MAG: nucleotidyltransferase domain-containing protein [Deltaproteobacteria bacterium]|nr:nucleotidyltransferase domain-containing protein [Deltaproteobacteria bacterium]
METPEQRTRQLRTYLGNQRYVQAAYLFGSAAKGTFGPLSDVDVGIVFNSEAIHWHEQRLRLMEGLTWIFGVPRIDVVILNSAEPVLAHRVIYEGQPIFVRDEAARVRMEKKILSAYLDTSFLRSVQRASIRKHLKEGEYFG